MIQTLSHRSELISHQRLSESEKAMMDLASISAAVGRQEQHQQQQQQQQQQHQPQPLPQSPKLHQSSAVDPSCDMEVDEDDDDDKTQVHDTLSPDDDDDDAEIPAWVPSNSTPDAGCLAHTDSELSTMSKSSISDVTVRPQALSSYTAPHGLVNLGNTCYFNSALQMLCCLETGLVRDLWLSSNKKPSSCEQEPQTVLEALQEVLFNMRDDSSNTTIDPTALKSAIDGKISSFVGNRQHDAHEFLCTLLDLLHEESKETTVTKTQTTNEEDTIMETTREMPLNKGDGNNNNNNNNKSTLSLTQLEPADISRLLHDDQPDEQSPQQTPVTNNNDSDWTVGHNDDDDDDPALRPSLVGGRATWNQHHQDIQPTCVVVAAAAATTTSQCKANADDTANTDTTTTTTRETSLVDSHFSTQVRVTLTCDSCSYVRSKTEMYRCLSIDVGSDDDTFSDLSTTTTKACTDTTSSTISVEEGIRRFFAPEKRQIKCEKCFFETATQTMTIERIPNALLLHFKRFIVEWDPQECRVSYSKNQSPVDIGDTLCLDEYCAVNVTRPHCDATTNDQLVRPHVPKESSPDFDSSCSITTCVEDCAKYGLKSIVNHIGSSTSCGHYTADVCLENQWFQCNDSKVTAFKDNTEESLKTAYMVMYELES